MANQRVEVAQAQLAELLTAVENGEEVILTRNGEPVARLLPAQRTAALVSMRGPRTPGTARGLVFIRDDFDDPLDCGGGATAQEAATAPSLPDREPGTARGLVTFGDGFDAPLDFRDYV